jgi:hypothetical protein
LHKIFGSSPDGIKKALDLIFKNELSEKSVQRRSKKLVDNAPLPLGPKYKAMVYTFRRDLLNDLPNMLIIFDNLRVAFTDVDTRKSPS